MRHDRRRKVTAARRHGVRLVYADLACPARSHGPGHHAAAHRRWTARRGCRSTRPVAIADAALRADALTSRALRLAAEQRAFVVATGWRRWVAVQRSRLIRSTTGPTSPRSSTLTAASHPDRQSPGRRRPGRRLIRTASAGRPGRVVCLDARMSVLAIDAGTTGVTAVVVTPEGTIAAKGYQEFAQHFPRPGWVEHSPEEIWQATLEATRAALQAYDAATSTADRHHQPARDGAALGPRDARVPPARDRVAGPSYGGHLHAAARGGPRGPGRRADRPAARPVLLRHQAGLAARRTSRTPGRWSRTVATRSAPSTPT